MWPDDCQASNFVVSDHCLSDCPLTLRSLAITGQVCHGHLIMVYGMNTGWSLAWGPVKTAKNQMSPIVSGKKSLYKHSFKFLPCLRSASPHHWKHDSVWVELSKYENWRYLAERITLQTWKLKISFLKFKLYQHFLLSHFVLTSELTPL